MTKEIYKKEIEHLKKQLHYITLLHKQGSFFQPEIREALMTSSLLISTEIIKCDSLIKELTNKNKKV